MVELYDGKEIENNSIIEPKISNHQKNEKDVQERDVGIPICSSGYYLHNSIFMFHHILIIHFPILMVKIHPTFPYFFFK